MLNFQLCEELFEQTETMASECEELSFSVEVYYSCSIFLNTFENILTFVYVFRSAT